MKKIKVEDAVGHVLCHDMTRIVKDEVKDAWFRKGHVVREEDIPVLLSMGKDNLYVWEAKEGMLHEDEAALRLFEICNNEHMTPTPVKEGKIEFVAEKDGLLVIDVDTLNQINSLGDIIIATRHTNTVVKKGDKLAGTRVIPLVIDEKKIQEAELCAKGKKILSVYPFSSMKCGLITTGNEVFNGRIQDTFSPVIVNKIKKFNMEVTEHVIVDDKLNNIKTAILEMKEKNVDIIICTGGMSVDPDDMTPGAIKASGVDIITYGAPVLPGAMFLLGYFSDGVPILGLPGCVMYAKSTIFDLVLPRVAAGRKVTKNELARLGHGGLCLECPVCHYPNCVFGKGN